MTLPKRIPTEIVQLFSSAEAWMEKTVKLTPKKRRKLTP